MTAFQKRLQARATAADMLWQKARITALKRQRARKDGYEVDPLLCTTKFWREVLAICRYCELCGSLLSLGPEKIPSRLTVDRVDNLKGYTIENTAVLCWTCNARKRDTELWWLKKLLAFLEPRINPPDGALIP